MMNTSQHGDYCLNSNSETSVSSCSDRRRTRDGQLRVSFGEDTEHTIPRRKALSKEERKMVWYTDKELRKISKQVRRIVKKKIELDEQEDCWRGLEYFMETNRTNYRAPSKEEAVLFSDMRAAQDSAEAYTIYLETMDADLVNACFH